ncbi:uncharacterized protein C7orf50 homolog isoform X2 [Rhincodon typus]|uniref:uncharacterized protein C7orf50 homolog isoform X2 n=1 Tax=Rhincodon typus TaxID=259920 RepID=UPI002030F7C4|nr:uncharacterized protein C7orf50 homolog isoform X2 [Rhincodon typus]
MLGIRRLLQHSSCHRSPPKKNCLKNGPVCNPIRDNLYMLEDIEDERMEMPMQQEQEELTAEEKRKIERKLKKERKKKDKQLLREAGVLVEKVKPQEPSASDLALEYLTRWSKKHKDWRFQKTRQTWLLKHMYDCHKVIQQVMLLDNFGKCRREAQNYEGATLHHSFDMGKF